MVSDSVAKIQLKNQINLVNSKKNRNFALKKSQKQSNFDLKKWQNKTIFALKKQYYVHKQANRQQFNRME